MSHATLPAGWRMVRFGDVVRQVKDRVDPEASGIERFVAGEHMETDDLHIRRWGTIGDGYLGPAFHMRFKPGHVLYGSRRTYLRKVAVAEFDGICANTTFVLEPSVPELLPEFLPVVMSTEAFHTHSVEQSKGSVNPYINYRDLAWYEFALPTPAAQIQIVETLRRVGEAADAYRAVLAASASGWAALLMEASVRYEMRSASLEEVCREPITYGIVQAGPIRSEGVPYVRVSDMTESELLEPELLPRTSTAIAERYKRSACEPGDLVFALRGPIGLVRVVPEELKGVNLTQGTARLSPDPSKVSTECLQWALQSPSVEHQYRVLRKGSTFQELSLGALRQVVVSLPPPSDQARFVRELDSVADVHHAASRARSSLERLGASLREGLLRGRLNVQ